VITESCAKGSTRSYYIATLYLWSGADGLAPTEVANWFRDLGATDVMVSAVLDDQDNNIVNGYCVDDAARCWEVCYFLP
jgi:hypothetical protein